MANDYSDWKAYQYTPSSAAAAVVVVLFGLATAATIVQMVFALSSSGATGRSKRQVCSLIPFIIGGLAEVIGYIGRILSHSDTEKLGPYIMQSILLLIAPAFFAATIYMTLARVIEKINCDHLSLIPLKWLTKIFVIGDVLSLLLQAAGGGIQASNNYKLGEKLIIIGLFVQIAFFGFFIIVMGIFQFKVYNSPTTRSISLRHSPSRYRNWQMIIVSLSLCSLLIFLRSIVRVIEYLQGQHGTIISHEVFLYLLDALPMFLNMVVFNLQDVGRFYVSIYQGSEDLESVEMIEPKYLPNKHNNAPYRQQPL